MYMDIQIENHIVKLDKRINKQMEIYKNRELNDLDFHASIVKVNMRLHDIYDALRFYESEQPKKEVFVNLKHSLENLSKVHGFRPEDNNHFFNVYKQPILVKINEIINKHVERSVAPTPTRSYSRRTPRTRSSGGKTKTKKNKTNKKR
uniref:Uncharacterized protein n=1 Tax=viral metagenome TaxID=1070528 RepID=A0A6C0F588_9ZZZZ